MPHKPVDIVLETAACGRLANARHRETGFCCPFCEHPHGRSIATRPRIRVCRKCQRQSSVTAGTLLYRSRLPVSVWEQAGVPYECGEVLSGPVLALLLGVSWSTAWWVNQRILHQACRSRTAELRRLAGFVSTRLRRPRCSAPPLHPDAPQRIRRLHEDVRDGLRPYPTVTVSVDRVEDSGAYRLGEIDPLTRRLPEGQPPDPGVPALHAYLRRTLVVEHQTVTLRRLPVWVAGLLAAYDRLRGVEPPLTWLETVAASAPCPLRELDPWRQRSAWLGHR
jgi:hypothetical protein